MPHTTLRPKITRHNFGPVIVIRRKSNHLFLYNGSHYRRFFVVATGQSQYPTPLGRFSTWLKSHSACGMCMRMQPCDAE